VDEFYDNAPEELQAMMQYIYSFLLAATGYDEAHDLFDQVKSPRSQLACYMDPTVLEWTSDQFGSSCKFDNIKAQVQQTTRQLMNAKSGLLSSANIIKYQISPPLKHHHTFYKFKI